MPTEIHELSISSITFNYPVPFRSDIEWRDVSLSDIMSCEALLLQEYRAKSALTPIAFEWWHFNNLSGLEDLK